MENTEIPHQCQKLCLYKNNSLYFSMHITVTDQICSVARKLMWLWALSWYVLGFLSVGHVIYVQKNEPLILKIKMQFKGHK